MRRPITSYSLPRRRADAGFTLVEMLVAMFIFSVISVGTLGSMQSAVQAREATAEATTRHESLSLLRATLRADLSQIILRDNRDAFGGRDQVIFRAGFNDLLDFTRIGRVNPAGIFARSDIQRVRYFIEDGNFIRRALGHENPGPLTQSRDRILMGGITSAEITLSINDIEIAQLEVPAGSQGLNIDYAQLVLRFEGGRELTQVFEMEAF